MSQSSPWGREELAAHRPRCDLPKGRRVQGCFSSPAPGSRKGEWGENLERVSQAENSGNTEKPGVM